MEGVCTVFLKEMEGETWCEFYFFFEVSPSYSNPKCFLFLLWFPKQLLALLSSLALYSCIFIILWSFSVVGSQQHKFQYSAFGLNVQNTQYTYLKVPIFTVQLFLQSMSLNFTIFTSCMHQIVTTQIQNSHQNWN